MPFQRGLRAGLTCAALLAGACDRKHPEPAPATAPAPAPAPAQPGCTLAPIALKVAPTGRIVAIGDLHGDFDAARDALRAAGVLGADGHWSGGTTTLVQTGDVLDRGDGESKILALLDQLATEAPKAKGQVILLLGNHELMNAAHDFRYVTPGGAHDFDGDREHELGPGGVWARRLAHHNVIAIVGDTVFSHAGVLPAWADALDRINLDARCWLDAQTAEQPAALTSEESPVWTRAYGGDAVDCAVLKDALGKLGAKRMVVGHTVQPQGINGQCDGALWRIDVGMSKAYGGPIQALELGETPKVLTGSRD
jgi:hypothetical protein